MKNTNQGGKGGSVTRHSLIETMLYGSDRLGNYTRTVDMTGTGNGGPTPLEPGEVRISVDTEINAYAGNSYLVDAGVELTLGTGFEFTSTATELFSVRIAAADNSLPQQDEGISGRFLYSRQYELKDHLGNVRAVVSDVKLSTITNGVPGAYTPDIVSLHNYYPFGMEQPGRQYGKDYRYGFNGKERDQNGEWGLTNYDYGFRIYNPAIAKFLSVDPLTKEYPWYTPYQFSGNKPINSVDMDGLEELSSKELNGEGVYRLGAIINQNGTEYQFQGNGRWVRVYSGPTRNGTGYSTLNLWEGVPEGLEGHNGYTYDLNDLRMRYRIMYGPSYHLKQAILQYERRGWAEPLTGYNFWNTYGSYEGQKMLFEAYITEGLAMAEGAQGGSHQPKLKKFKGSNIAPPTLPKPRKVGNLKGGPLENATQVSGRFKLEGGPANGTVFRADNQGNITSYATYDSKGMIIKRVDVTGSPHRGVDTPHVIEYGRNTYTDNQGNIVTRVDSPDTNLPPRRATPSEIP